MAQLDPAININLNINLPAQSPEASVDLLQKLLAAVRALVPATSGVAADTSRASERVYPPIRISAGEAYQHVAQENLRLLKEGTIPDDGWGSVKDLPQLIGSLRADTRKVVLRAIDNGGHITRDEVYEILGRDKTKTLNGFTKPVSKLFDRLVAGGELRGDARPLLEPIYRKSKSFQQAQGFAVPVQVVSLMNGSVRAAT